MQNHLPKFVEIMQNAGLTDLTIQAFSTYYYKILEGASGKLTENDIDPPESDNIARYKNLHSESYAPLEKLVVIKLNGGLGTSMGLKKAKTLLKVKGELNFLDIIARQIIELREESEKCIPLMFMHSFNTREDSLNHLKIYNDLPLPNLPMDFVQNKFPKIRQEDLAPLQNEDDHKNWNPPGHGEIYSVLSSSGVLDKLLEQGFEYAFISNSDNLGAVVDEKILGYFAEHKIPFMMEVCQRTEVDKKGGHLAQTKNGQLLLRESAQCPDDEVEKFQDINRYSYFNTNNLWVNLKALKQKLFDTNNLLPLQLILNGKEVDGVKVYQVESAMGAAISVFKGSKAILVNRDRFAPVKKTNDLLAIWSDAYKLTDNYRLILNGRSKPPKISLDDRYYKTIDQLQDHFEYGIPDLRKCKSLEINANVYFEKGVHIVGNVKISKDADLEHCTLENEEYK
ncbi:MAG: UTP--glucose-1-phosphate uridylyltransferase [Candidatus Cloacimonetes bacterium]|nr:UTP--glucose-1-phosphate uridylyltransferase [Candidatus Cloacimonadota bacterium]MCF7813822.1 UTP--glucose-1-phosphate uridylyltransferase [Candidatus Cloacimonadota bacterium]MCF7868260.1 UTP--glucose-1-phosphate uridylyltransferase [Candidatus Cloacimonadota bacterium]MCF7883766.1 UTP--glucose-1-phosphate uridylyltransferase [Candidatus Cloacimonadota bacterium]